MLAPAQQDDGTWLVPTRAEGEGSLRGDGMLPLTPEHPQYEQWTAWLTEHKSTIAWREQLHPRDFHGRFAHGHGGHPSTLTRDDRRRPAEARSARGGDRGRRSDVVRFAEVDASAPEGYRRYIGAIRANPHAEFITEPTREELAHKRVFLSENGDVGVTISEDGEMGNLFANPTAPKGAGGKAIDMATANGATWLNCFDGYLPTLYQRHGFAEVARLRFDHDQEPNGWNDNTQDSPDIVFMALGAPEHPDNTVEDWTAAEQLAISEHALTKSAHWDEHLHPRDRHGEFARVAGSHAMPDYSQSSLDQLERHHSDLTYGRGRFAKLSAEDRQRHLDAIEQALIQKSLEGDLEERAVAAQQLALFRMRVAPEFRRHRSPAKPKLKPAGGIGKSITLPKSGKMREPAAATLAAIDDLIDVPALDEPIPLTVTSGKNKLGAFGRKTVARTDPRTGEVVGTKMVPAGIRLSSRNHPRLTLAHEIGHFVDSAHLSTEIKREDKQMPAFGSFLAAARAEIRNGAEAPEDSLREAVMSQPHQEEWDEWWAAIEASPEYEKLGTASFNNYGTHVYLRRPMEVWARAFSQWAAIRSGDPALMADLEATRDPEQIAAQMKPHTYYRNFRELTRPATADDVPDSLRYRQWSDENFNRIGAAITTLMRAYGILKPRTPSSTSSQSTANPTPASTSGIGSPKSLLDLRGRFGHKRYIESQHRRDWRGRWSAGGSGLGIRMTRGGLNDRGIDEHVAVARIVKTFDDNPTATEDARWYQDAHNQIGEWADALNIGIVPEHQVDTQTFAGVVAACSANEIWDERAGKTRAGKPNPLAGERTFPNLRSAARAVRIYQRNPKGTCANPEQTVRDLGGHPGLLPQSLTKSLHLLCGQTPDDKMPSGKLVLGGCKERSFYNCLCWPDATDSVAIDRHAARIITGESPPETPLANKVIATPNSYAWAAEMYRQAAEQISQRLGVQVTPDMVQAASWAQWRRENEAASRARPSRAKAIGWQAQGQPLEVESILDQLVGESEETDTSARVPLTPAQQALWAEIDREVDGIERKLADGTQPPE